MQEYEGHLVAHIKVPPTYFDAQQQSPAGGTPRVLSRTPSEAEAGALDGAAAGGVAAAGAAPSGGSAPHPPRFAAASPQEVASLMLPGAGPAAQATAVAAAAASPAAAAGAGDGSGAQQADQQQQQQHQLQPGQAQQLGQPPGQHPQQAQPQSPGQQQQQQALSSSEAEAIRQASESLTAAMGGTHSAHSTPPYRCAEGGLDGPSCWLAKQDEILSRCLTADTLLDPSRFLGLRLPTCHALSVGS